MNHKTGIIISGLPASGKGTQCQQVASAKGFVHIDTGQKLRREIEMSTALGLEMTDYTSRGKFVPDSIIHKVMEHALKQENHAVGYIFDGFPRTRQQAEMLEDFGKEFGFKIKAMIYLEVDQQKILERIHKRAAAAGRKDDQDPQVIQHRIQIQRNQAIELKEYYRKKNLLFLVDGNQKVEEVSREIMKILECDLSK
jgi:adenylate kinase